MKARGKCPLGKLRAGRWRYIGNAQGEQSLRVLCVAFDGAFQGSVERGFGFVVFLLRDLALLVLDFQLKEFFLQSFQQHGGGRWSR